MLAVQNVVPYKVMGVSTSTIQFLRSVGGTMGVAVMFSLIQSQYHEGLVRNVPEPVQSQPELMNAINDPQFLLNTEASTRVEQAFLALPQGGEALFQGTLQAVKVSLADGISEAFFVSVFVLLATVVIGAFMKEVPLRKVHFVGAEGDLVPEIGDFAEPPSTVGAAPAPSPAITGASNGSSLKEPAPRPWLAPVAVAGALCLAAVALVTFRRR
jgi:hypothetical protein